MEFPSLVYKCPGNFSCNGGTYDYKSVVDESSLQKAEAEGWHKTLTEAQGGIDEVSAPTRSELEQKAVELGLKFDGRTTDRKLNLMIEAALNVVD